MDQIQQAAELLRRGEIVAFPTETVYGLGADATKSAAVRKIFAAKGRPSNNPLIVHVPDARTARRYVVGWDERATKLAERFWPGPITLVLEKVREIVDEATAGLRTVGVRVPNHPVALELLQAFGGAVAAPSANRSNRISPTTAEHVRQEFGDSIPIILDGGACRVGIESTVLDLTGPARILRPGGVGRELIEQVLGESVDYGHSPSATDQAFSAPGQLPVHYAPKAPAYYFVPSQWQEIDDWRAGQSHIEVLAVGRQGPEDYARHLYANLRSADATARIILIEMPPDEPGWAAVRDRLKRAARPWKLSDHKC
ncbi:MAG TPA: L-threonylcarbamoyladenylate synthase [Tepidisphaeraceae bacterium]|nr:L-threonylcarbamoyladenylate synthase [Tepidisphaeraceae bacterium]